MGKNRKSRKSFDGQFMYYKNIVIKYKTMGVATIKTKLDFEDIKRYIPRLYIDPRLKKYICGTPFPKQLSDLGKSPKPYGDIENIEKEIQWQVCVLTLFQNEINSFLEKKSVFSQHILKGEYEDANKVLEAIRDEFGYSLWYLENKVLLVDQLEGLEKQKDFTNSISRDESNDFFVRFFMHYYSVRIERNLSAVRYNELIMHEAKQLEQGEWYALSQYFKFKLDFFGDSNYQNYITILAYENNFSIIDKYQTFVRVCKLLVSSGELSESYNSIAKSLLYLANTVKDRDLLNIINHLKNGQFLATDQSTSSLIVMFDLYTKGNYEECITLCEKLLSDNVVLFEVWEILVRSLVRLNKIDYKYSNNVNIDNIIEHMFNVVYKNDKSNESFHELLKIVIIYHSHFWIPQLYAFLIKEYYNDNRENIPSFVVIGILSSKMDNPIAGLYVSNEHKEEYYNHFEKYYGKSISVDLLKSLGKCNEYMISNLNIPEERKNKYKAIIFKGNSDFDNSIKYYEDLLHSGDVITKQDAISGLIRCYLNTNNNSKCFELVTREYFKNENIFVKFPISELVEIIENNEDEELKRSICTPIISDLYTKYVGTEKEFVRTYAYEEFLYYNGFSRPSELSESQYPFEKDKLIYFLRNICIFQVMDGSPSFNSTEDIERERILVCQMLRNLDKEREFEYSDEIKNITQKLMIRKGIQEIENSKIYVDIDGIKKSVEKNLRESYSRYITYLSNPLIGDEPDYIKIASNEYEGLEFMMAGNEKYSLFNTMFIELRNNFISSNRYGLDGYLSIGIRHGTLAGQLRSPFESAHLITKKENDTNTYYDNEYWKERYQHIYEKTLDKLLAYLKEFSASIDELIYVLKKEWIQIKTEDKNQYGLFNFQITVDEIDEFRKKVTPDTKYETFVDMVFEKLWEITEESLAVTRCAISSILKSQFNEVINRLQLNIESLKQDLDISDINMSINTARTAIQYEIDRIANWFKRVRAMESADYYINLPVEIAKEMIINIYPNRCFDIDIDIKSISLFKGKSLKSLVDIFFILFDNIIKHSELNNCPDSIVTINEGENIKILVKNKVSKEIDRGKVKNVLEEIRNSIGKNEFMDNVVTEGGTGLKKVKKILMVDLNCKHTIKFDITDDYDFVIEIFIKKDGLIV